MQAERGKDELDPLEFDDFVREKMKLLEMNPDFLARSVNEGFSGGEKKRNEILQMALLEPKLAILDETDSGLDIDALASSPSGVNQLSAKDNAIVLVTHYQRLLNYIVPDYVHVMDAGRIVKTGGKELALELEARGYDWVGAELKARGGSARMNAAATTTGYLDSLLQGRAPAATRVADVVAERAARARGRSRRRAHGADHARRGLALHRHLAADQAVLSAQAHGLRPAGRGRNASI